MSDSSAPRERQVIMVPGGKADPNQAYERMRVYTEEGAEWTPPVPEPVAPIDPVPAEIDDPEGYFQDHLTSTWQVVDADKVVQITLKGKCHANGSGDLGRMVLYVSGDNGATAEELDTLATTSTTDVDFSLSGIIPAGYKVLCSWTQDAAGQGGTANFQKIIVQPLTN